jgi:chromosome segregation ATPase
MAKPKLPYERVAEAAFQLHARGEKIVQRSVRAISGGDPAAVGEHLKQWKREHPELAETQRTATPELPAPFLRVLQDEIQRRIAEACAALEGQLATAQENIEDLTRQVGELQEENSSFERQRDDLGAENERLQGQVKQQASDLDRLQQLLATEQKAAEAARVDLAEARLRAKGQQELADSLKNERDSLRQSIDTERSGRLEAEKSLTGANAAVEQLRKRVEQLSGFHDALETERDTLQASLDAERAERSTAEKHLAACQAEAKGVKERADDLQQREAALRAELVQLRTPGPPNTTGGARKSSDE